MRMVRKWLTRLLLFGAFALFLVSLGQYGCYYDRAAVMEYSTVASPEGFPGYGMLLGVGGGLAWFANPAMFACVFLTVTGRSKKTVLAFGAVAILLALAFLDQRTIIVDEGGDPHQIVAYGLGYWIWMSSTAVAFLAALLRAASFESDMTEVQVSPSIP